MRTCSVERKLGKDYSLTASTIKGICTVWSQNCSCDEKLSVTVALSVSTGKAKVVHIDATRNVTTITEYVGKENKDVTTTVTLTKDKNKIKIVALDCESLKLSFSAK